MREATASGVDNAASPRLADTAERDYFTLEADHYAKTTGRKGKKYINEQVQIELPISMGNIPGKHFCAEYKYAKVIKPSNPFTNVCWVSV